MTIKKQKPKKIINMGEEKRYAKQPIISHKKYKMFSEQMRDIIADDEKTEKVLEQFRDIMMYNPETKFYIPERAKQQREKLKIMAKEKDKTTYELGGQKSYYHRKKNNVI